MNGGGSRIESSPILRQLLAQVESERRWRTAVEDVLDSESGARGHLAVMHEPYLSLIVAGRKTVESRFSKMQVAPYQQVRRGDLLLFKRLAGPVTAIARVADADFYVLDVAAWNRLRARFEPALAAQDESFWVDRQEARYASLIRLGAVRTVAPIHVAKRDRRGWVVLNGRGASIHRDQLDLVPDADTTGALTDPQREGSAPRRRDCQLELRFE